jgi:hypothetical protein
MLQTPAAIACGGCNIQSHFFTGAACTQSQIFIRSVAAARRPVFSKRSLAHPLSTLLRMVRKKEKSIFLKGVNKIHLSALSTAPCTQKIPFEFRVPSLKRTTSLSLLVAFPATAIRILPSRNKRLSSLPILGKYANMAWEGKIYSTNK